MSDLPPMLQMMGVQEAIEAVEASANRAQEGWSSEAYSLLLQFIAENPLFKAEDARAFAHIQGGLAKPPDLRAWGGVVQRAAREGRIKKVGHGKSNNKLSHYRPVMIWQAL